MSLRLESVGYRYAGALEPALLDVDLALPDGAVVGVTGASESGKSTLCLVAAGLAPRAIGGRIRGDVILDGQAIDGWPMHRLAAEVSIGFQNPSTQLSGVTTTVFEEVAFGPMNLALPRGEIIDRTWEALDAVGLTELAGEEGFQRQQGPDREQRGERLLVGADL